MRACVGDREREEGRERDRLKVSKGFKKRKRKVCVRVKESTRENVS